MNTEKESSSEVPVRQENYTVRFLKNSLHSRKVSGVSYDDLKEKSTKDKNIVIRKLNLLETLMDEFLHIKKKETVEKFDITSEKLQQFVDEFNESDIVKMIRVRPEREKIKIAVQSLMVVSGKTQLSDKAVRDISKAILLRMRLFMIPSCILAR